jgi:hypothetical protein
VKRSDCFMVQTLNIELMDRRLIALELMTGPNTQGQVFKFQQGASRCKPNTARGRLCN